MWGSQTEKAIGNFGRGGTPREIIRAYAEVKLAALRAAAACGAEWPGELTEAFEAALAEIIRGDHDGEFPLNLAQGGAGTSLHLNLNEVVSRLAALRCGIEADPIEDLARFQSTNDTFATAVVVAALRGLEAAEAAVIRVQEALAALEERHSGRLMVGRTEFQDALPMRVGQLFGGWAGMLERDRWRLSKLFERVREVPLGGTAIGTCFSAPREYVNRVVNELRAITGLPLARSQNLPDAVAHKDALAELAAGYALAAGNLETITGGMLFYSSSPVGEIGHPELQWGSSIMPAKVNPVLLEYCSGLAARVTAEADLVRHYARGTRMQLNAYLPFLSEALLAAGGSLVAALEAMVLFLTSMEVDTERMEFNLAQSPALLNALLPRIGYHRLKEIARQLNVEPPRDLDEFAVRVAETLGLGSDEVASWIAPEELTGGAR